MIARHPSHRSGMAQWFNLAQCEAFHYCQPADRAMAGGLDVDGAFAAAPKHGSDVDMGHQGLFFEPFKDVTLGYNGLEDRLNPASRGLYFNRARWYDASKGRFTTSDPNQTGMPQQYDIALHGFEPLLMTPNLDLLTTYADGPSLFASRGQNPMRNKDPPGEFLGLAGLGMGATTGAELQGDWSEEVADAGMGIMDSIQGMFDAAALDDLADLYWATDWEEPDYLYSRSGWSYEGAGAAEGGGGTLVMAGNTPAGF